MKPRSYKRRKPAILLNLWLYRRMVLLAFVLGLLLWFIWINNESVIVRFPFGLSEIKTFSGIAILFGVLVGGLAGAIGTTIFQALRRSPAAPTDPAGKTAWEKPAGPAEERPPADYAAHTPEGFPDARWSDR